MLYKPYRTKKLNKLQIQVTEGPIIKRKKTLPKGDKIPFDFIRSEQARDSSIKAWAKRRGTMPKGDKQPINPNVREAALREANRRFHIAKLRIKMV